MRFRIPLFQVLVPETFGDDCEEETAETETEPREK